MPTTNICYAHIDSILNANHTVVDKVCYPLFKKTPIESFEYTRFYDSGEILSLTTSPDVVASEYKNQLLPTLEELNAFSTFGLRITFLSHHMPLPPAADDIDPEKYQKAISNAADHHLYHVLCFVDRFSNHYRVCSFAVKKSASTIFNFYLNATSILNSFINYFEIEAEHLISPKNPFSKIILPYYLDIKCRIPFNTEASQDKSKIEFLERSPVIPCLDTQSITMREKDCLKLVGQGYTMKNIAKQLNISPRTVEQHLRNIKDKCGVNTKNQLVDIWHDHFKFFDTKS